LSITKLGHRVDGEELKYGRSHRAVSTELGDDISEGALYAIEYADLVLEAIDELAQASALTSVGTIFVIDHFQDLNLLRFDILQLFG